MLWLTWLVPFASILPPTWILRTICFVCCTYRVLTAPSLCAGEVRNVWRPSALLSTNRRRYVDIYHDSLFISSLFYPSFPLSDVSWPESIMLPAIDLFLPTRNQMGSSRCNLCPELLRLLWQPWVTINEPLTQKKNGTKIMTHTCWLFLSEAS